MNTGRDRLLALLLFALVSLALWAVFLYAPNEKQMGIVQRIFYFHVPSAITAYIASFLVCLGSILYLRTRQPIWDRLAVSAAELGIAFCIIVLITGPVWARPVWGTFWRWEPRLTSMLIMFTTYVAYVMVRHYTMETVQMRRYAAVVGICGFTNVPLVHYSVLLWAPEHQLHPTDNVLNPAMQQTLYLSFAAIFLLFFFLLIRRMALESLADEIAGLEQQLRMS